jgi:arylsulfatase
MHFYPWEYMIGFQHRRVAEDKRWLEVRDDYWHFLHERGHRKYHGRDHEGYLENRGAIVNKLPWELQVDRWVGDQAVEFIRAHGREGPFAAMVSFPGPHCPYDPAPEFLEGLEPEAMPEPAPDAGDTPGLRERCIAGNKRPWNGVDYTEFTRAHMLKIRQHYAALVRQIDVEVGAILDALDEQGLSESTAIVFTSDHGDYLGDHGLIGKATFYEASFHVPLIVAGPGIAPGACDDLVSLTDVTATMLRLAGAEVPDYMDSRPLPGLGIEGGRGHDHLIGALGDCWLSYRPPWRLAKYATGEATLFNVDEDPLEQRNRIEDPSCRAIRRELDGALTAAVMRGILGSHFAEKAQNGDGSQDPIFGREGWRRAYPQRIELSGLRVEA